jgi:hypothetical protein
MTRASLSGGSATRGGCRRCGVGLLLGDASTAVGNDVPAFHSKLSALAEVAVFATA